MIIIYMNFSLLQRSRDTSLENMDVFHYLMDVFECNV